MRESILKSCAWLVHLYTATTAIAGLLSLDLIARGNFKPAFFAMAYALFVDSTDGPLARALQVRMRIPDFDGSLLDNVVDYLTYVVVPTFLLLRAGLITRDVTGLGVIALVILASAYGFCRDDAKTTDHYFLGFPSYWNIVALYLFCLGLPVIFNELIVGVLALAVFPPIKFIYPNRTEEFRPLTLTLCAIWGVTTVALLLQMPNYSPFFLYTSLAFILYYFVMSFALYLHPARVAARRTAGAPLQNLTTK